MQVGLLLIIQIGDREKMDYNTTKITNQRALHQEAS